MTTPPPIDDDHFDYEGGQRQCISGFGRNAKECVQQLLNNPYSDAAHNTINWHIDELVRWCRGLNREVQEVKAETTKQRRIMTYVPARILIDAKERAGLGVVIKPMGESNGIPPLPDRAE